MTIATIRKAKPSDVGDIHHLLMELAVFEKIDHLVESNEGSTHRALFGEPSSAEALVAELDGSIIATAIYFHNYSTFMGRKGLYLEDIYVKPDFRGQGIGKTLLVELAKTAITRGCPRMEWTVLDWNTKAIDFYNKIGANIMTDWRLVRLSGNDIETLANQ
ncbi:MAG: GNAT family N-acetyltransferase [Verrucomicrobiaceae bacterium]|nr:GNAT family N-acetyltransferase [Verrucomicrobiaceae bacterium]